MKEVQYLETLLAEARRQADAATLAEVCKSAGIGVADVLGKGRSQRVAKARAAVAWALHRKLKWPQKRVASALGVSVRAVQKMAVSSSKDTN